MGADLWPSLVAGQESFGASTIVVSNKFDDTAIAEVAIVAESELNRAAAAAAEVAATVAALPTETRRRVLLQTRDAVASQAEEFEDLIVKEVGKPRRDARAEVERCILTFDLAADACRASQGEVFPVDFVERNYPVRAFWTRRPAGPLLLVTPFNFPLNLVAHKVAPAIAAGCPFVLKPAPRTPLSALRLGAIIRQTEWPSQAMSVVVTDDERAQQLVRDERFRVVSFTGSERIGWLIRDTCGRKRCLLELGGNATVVIDETVPLSDSLIERLGVGLFGNSGQSCISVQRVLVHHRHAQELAQRLVAHCNTLPWGDPDDRSTVVGPVISDHDVRRILSVIDDAMAAGARLLTGGRAVGRVVLPTLLENVDDGTRLARDEVFGPVGYFEPFEDFDQALARVNEGRFGLQAGVFTERADRAFAAFERLDVGGVVINDVPTLRVDNQPYGGNRSSGLGREGVRFAIEEFSEIRSMVWRPTSRPSP